LWNEWGWIFSRVIFGCFSWIFLGFLKCFWVFLATFYGCIFFFEKFGNRGSIFAKFAKILIFFLAKFSQVFATAWMYKMVYGLFESRQFGEFN
jgi:hypothetical protein